MLLGTGVNTIILTLMLGSRRGTVQARKVLSPVRYLYGKHGSSKIWAMWHCNTSTWNECGISRRSLSVSMATGVSNGMSASRIAGDGSFAARATA